LLNSAENREHRVSSLEKREVVDRVLQSSGFVRAPKLREFLRYVCEPALASDETPLVREQDIGRAVYHRAEDYNPAEDNIVRVEARNLRRKLDEFFSGEGKDLPVRLHIPRGGYTPAFERRELPEVDAVPMAPVTLPDPPVVIASPPPPNPPLRQQNLERAIFSAVIVLLAATCGLLWSRNVSLQANLASPALWSTLFDSRHNTYLVLADSGFVVVQDILKRSLTLSDYLKRDRGSVFHSDDPKSPTHQAAELVGQPHLTSVTGARLVGSIFDLRGISRDRLSVRYARELEPRDFKGNHIILIGSSRSNPWVELFEPKLNFRFEFDFARSRPVVRNRVPLPGELPVYEAGGQDGGSDAIYSTIALVPNLSGDGNVLIVSGTGTAGTESASEMLFNNNLASQMIQKLRLQKDGGMQYFEVLLKSSKLGTTSRGGDIVAYRILQK
jgi:hypothetical protein